MTGFGMSPRAGGGGDQCCSVRSVNGLRGVIAASVLYPLAECVERRHVRSKYRTLAQEMQLPFARRRQRSWSRRWLTPSD